MVRSSLILGGILALSAISTGVQARLVNDLTLEIVPQNGQTLYFPGDEVTFNVNLLGAESTGEFIRFFDLIVAYDPGVLSYDHTDSSAIQFGGALGDGTLGPPGGSNRKIPGDLAVSNYTDDDALLGPYVGPTDMGTPELVDSGTSGLTEDYYDGSLRIRESSFATVDQDLIDLQTDYDPLEDSFLLFSLTLDVVGEFGDSSLVRIINDTDYRDHDIADGATNARLDLKGLDFPGSGDNIYPGARVSSLISVPSPAPLLLLAVGFAGLAARRRLV